MGGPGQLRVIVASTPEERLSAARLRYDVLVSECGYTIDGAAPDRGLTDVADPASWIVLACLGDEPVGTMTVSPFSAVAPSLTANMRVPETSRFLRRDQMLLIHKAAVRPERRNRLTLAAMVDYAFHHCVPPHARLAFLNCDARLAPLYKRAGFEPYGEPFFFPGSQTPAILLAMRINDRGDRA